MGIGACPHTTAENGTTIEGSTRGLAPVVDVSCGGAWFSPAYLVLFTPDATDTYTFDTFGSSYDTVLAVFEGQCKSKELACNDDVYDLDTLSALTLRLHEGQPVTVLVSGYEGDYGNFVLHISR